MGLPIPVHNTVRHLGQKYITEKKKSLETKQQCKQDTSITPANLLEKPGTGIGPMAIGRRNRNVENFRSLVEA